MIASSEEEAFDMYNNYAYHKGFSIRKDTKNFKRGTNELIRRTFVCSKEGFKEFIDPTQEKKYERIDTRCGCRARVVFKVKNGIYEINQLVTEHNHPMIELGQRHLLRFVRKIHDTTKGVINSMTDASIRATKTYAYLVNEVGGYQNVGFIESDCQNFIKVERSKTIAAGDSQSLINCFKHKQAENPMFFYTVQVDDDNRMTNFFWRDGISKLDYECFGDVVIFDTTYTINKYNMVCAPFVGVNYHWKNVLFGCAFLCDETSASFVWLFDAFLESMDYKAPKTIFTDQDHAMANAIATVLPNTRHRLCEWHISKNAAINISGLYQKSGFKDMFNYLLYKCESESELEEKWKEMIDTWDCSNQSWLQKLYGFREKWAPPFSRETFSCNIRASQRSESTNNVFQHMACKTMTLTEFVRHYEQNAEKMREAEVIDDFNNVIGKLRIASRGSGILKHADKVYTHKLFAMFQDEFLQTTSLSVVENSSNEALHIYKMRMDDGTREHTVHFNSFDCSISCSCKQFESLGLLCRYALRVLNLNDVKNFPDKYILKRWTKVAKYGVMMERHGRLMQDNSGNSAKTLRLNKLMRRAFSVMNLCANYEATTEIAEHNLDITFEQFTSYNAASGATRVDDDIHTLPVFDTPVMDPPRRRQKGQTYGRMKGTLEKKKRAKKIVSKPQTLITPVTDIEMQSNVRPSRFYAPTENVPIASQIPGYSNIPFMSLLQANIPHLSQGSLNNFIGSAPNMYNPGEDVDSETNCNTSGYGAGNCTSFDHSTIN